MKRAASGPRWLAQVEEILKGYEGRMTSFDEAVAAFRTLGLTEGDFHRYLRKFRARARAP